jgi:hypothetical protein
VGCSRRLGLALLAAAVIVLNGCALGPQSKVQEVSGEHREALDVLYNDPLFSARPPGIGELLGEDFSTECLEGEPPIGGRSWVLLDDGADAVEFYKDLGEQSDWTVIEEHELVPLPSRDDKLGSGSSRRPYLKLEKSVDGYSFSASVTIGGSTLHEHIGLGVHASVDAPDVCR